MVQAKEAFDAAVDKAAEACDVDAWVDAVRRRWNYGYGWMDSCPHDLPAFWEVGQGFHDTLMAHSQAGKWPYPEAAVQGDGVFRIRGIPIQVKGA